MLKTGMELIAGTRGTALVLLPPPQQRLLEKFVARHSLFVITLLLSCLFARYTLADEIPPPFGLQWGESDERLARLLHGAKAQIVDKHPVGERDAWFVEGLLQAGLKRTVFYFKSGSLVEVELQYQSPDWDILKYDDFMSAVRRRIEQKYGPGQLLAKTRGQEGDVMQTIIGYKWVQDNTAIELFYYSAENSAQAYRTVSVHYKGY